MGGIYCIFCSKFKIGPRSWESFMPPLSIFTLRCCYCQDRRTKSRWPAIHCEIFFYCLVFVRAETKASVTKAIKHAAAGESCIYCAIYLSILRYREWTPRATLWLNSTHTAADFYSHTVWLSWRYRLPLLFGQRFYCCWLAILNKELQRLSQEVVHHIFILFVTSATPRCRDVLTAKRARFIVNNIKVSKVKIWLD